MRLTTTDLAWAAGLIDGEGCIRINRGRAQGKHLSPRYGVQLIVKMTHEASVRRLALMFGGSVYHKNAAVNRSELWGWQPNQELSRRAIEVLLPYLFTKAAEARLALQFFTLPLAQRGVKTPNNIIDARDKLFCSIRDMKTVNRLKEVI